MRLLPGFETRGPTCEDIGFVTHQQSIDASSEWNDFVVNALAQSPGLSLNDLAAGFKADFCPSHIPQMAWVGGSPICDLVTVPQPQVSGGSVVYDTAGSNNTGATELNEDEEGDRPTKEEVEDAHEQLRVLVQQHKATEDLLGVLC